MLGILKKVCACAGWALCVAYCVLIASVLIYGQGIEWESGGTSNYYRYAGWNTENIRWFFVLFVLFIAFTVFYPWIGYFKDMWSGKKFRLWLLDSYTDRGKIMSIVYTILNVANALLLYAFIAEPVMEVGDYVYRDKMYALLGAFLLYPVYFVFFIVAKNHKTGI